jgi:tetratricopeptide (TPR) repeat protein
MRNPLLISGAALCLAGLTACSSSPRLADRDRAAAAVDQMAQRRAEGARLAEEAQRYEDSDPQRAIETYRAALALDDSLHNAWNNMGTLLMERGNYADAVAAFQVSADLIPSDPRPLYNIGVAYQQNGWGDEAYRNFAQALERDPSHLPSMRGFVRASEMTGRADDRTIAVIRNALLRDTDEGWRTYLQRQRYRVEALIDNDR